MVSNGPAKLVMPRDEISRRITERIALGNSYLTYSVASQGQLHDLQELFRSWRDYNFSLLERAFSSDELAMEYRPIQSGRFISYGYDQSLKNHEDSLKLQIRANCAKLTSISDRLELFEIESSPTRDRDVEESASVGREVFVVHGHGPTKDEVARVVERAGATAIILAEQPNRGSPTLIEKLERESARASIAIILLTGDDEGRKTNSELPLRKRARQNVVAELGYFVAKLGRGRVIVLYEEDVETPSDFSGISYTALDSAGAWKYKLVEELRSAGLID